ncbi:MAG: gamma-glutamyltransferase family protein, partial [Acetobacteraceae bacterium]
LKAGPLATGAPGNLAGWCELVRAYGRKPLAAIFAPAIRLARDGFPLTEFNADSINSAGQELKSHDALYPEWARTYTAGTGHVANASILCQPDLARTLEAIVRDGPAHLYAGPLGTALVGHVRRLGGCLTPADLAAMQPRWLEPVAAAYRGLLVHTLPPPCQGFQHLLTLRILDGFDLAAMEHNGIDHLDTVLRAIRLAAGVRIANDNPSPERLAQLLSDETVAALRHRVGDGQPIDGPTEQWMEPPEPPPGTTARSQHTTSLSVADGEGNAVCITQSLGSKFGCGIVVPGTGVCLNNFLYWGETDPRGTNPMQGGGPLALPLAPTISTRAGRLALVLGTPGSYGICQTQPQAMVQHVDFRLPLQEAIDYKRARLTDGRKVQMEARISAATLTELRARGHDVAAPSAWTPAVGGMQAIAVDAQTGALTGAADPRRDGYVVAI